MLDLLVRRDAPALSPPRLSLTTESAPRSLRSRFLLVHLRGRARGPALFREVPSRFSLVSSVGTQLVLAARRLVFPYGACLR